MSPHRYSIAHVLDRFGPVLLVERYADYDDLDAAGARVVLIPLTETVESFLRRIGSLGGELVVLAADEPDGLLRARQFSRALADHLVRPVRWADRSWLRSGAWRAERVA
jgi:hypothetical protein